MTAEDLSLPALLGLGALIIVIGVVAGLALARRTAWAPAAGLALLVATPLVPHVPVALGFSLDDILPLLGIAFLVTAVDLRRLRVERPPLVLMVGLVLLIAAGVLASIANASSVSEALTMLFRSPGRYAFLAAIVILVALAEPAERRRLLVARGMAVLGSIEAVFGLAAFFLPLGGIGLEPTRKFSVLYFEVPGRIAGTLGISPNFLGAIFVLTIVLTAGLAIDARVGRDRWLLWISVLVQMFALTLTFTRASLGLAIVGLAVLMLVRGRFRYMVPVIAVVALGFLVTPSGTADPGAPATNADGTENTTGGPPVAVVRLTSDVPDRLALWTSATLMMIDHPFTGVGPGQTLIVAATNKDRYVNTDFGYASNSAHNTILLAGAETGVVGALGSLLVNLAIGFAALRIVLRRRSTDPHALQAAGAIAVLGYLAQGMVNNLFSVAVAGVVFAVVVGTFVVGLEVAAVVRPAPDGGAQRQRAPAGPPPEPSL